MFELSTQLPKDPRHRSLVKADMLAELFVRSAAAKNLLGWGPIHLSAEAILPEVHRRLLEDPPFWIAVLEKAKVIVNL